MFTLKLIFVILLMVPLLVLVFILLNRLMETALKYKDEAEKDRSATLGTKGKGHNKYE